MRRPNANRILRLLPVGAKRHLRQRLVDEFHRYYYRSGPWRLSTWLGVPVMQFPGDLLVLQEIIHETRPELIVETGTYGGGSAYFFAGIFDLLGHGRVVTIDIDHSRLADVVRDHPRITTLKGSSVSDEIREAVHREATGRRVMVYLDADHSEAAVRAELEAYADLVSPGCYIVVADSNVNGHPVAWREGGQRPGPFEAIRAFLRTRDDFAVDREREYHLVTFNPGGFLRRQPD